MDQSLVIGQWREFVAKAKSPVYEEVSLTLRCPLFGAGVMPSSHWLPRIGFLSTGTLALDTFDTLNLDTLEPVKLSGEIASTDLTSKPARLAVDCAAPSSIFGRLSPSPSTGSEHRFVWVGYWVVDRRVGGMNRCVDFRVHFTQSSRLILTLSHRSDVDLHRAPCMNTSRLILFVVTADSLAI